MEVTKTSPQLLPKASASGNIVRIGIVGAGANTTARHIPGLQALDGVKIVSVCNRSESSSERVARKFGIERIYYDWRKLVEADDTDAIVIGTWPYLHCPVTLAAFEMGKHVLCEARMAMNAREARTMYEASIVNPHLAAQVVPAPFTLGVDKTVQKLIADGYLGKILAVNVRSTGSFLDKDAKLHWRQDDQLSGLNIMNLGIWYECLMRWIGEAVRVTAMGKTFVQMRKDSQGQMRAIKIPEHLDVTADMACGAQSHFRISSVCGLSGGDDVWLFGDEGTLRFFENRLYGGRRGDTAVEPIDIPDENTGKWRVEEEFINAIRGKEKVKLTTFFDGLKYMEFTEAAAKSLAAGNSIPLGL